MAERENKNVGFDSELFEYITKSAGFTLNEAASAMGLSPRQLKRRMSGEVGFTAADLIAWNELVKEEIKRNRVIHYVFFRNIPGPESVPVKA